MQKKLKFIILMMSLLFGSTISVSKTTEKKDDFCSKDGLDNVDLSFQEMSDLRDERENIFTNEYYDIIKFLKDPEENSDELFDSFRASSALLIVLLILLLVSLIFFLLFCCGLFKSNKNQVKTYTTVGCICFWMFFILFVCVVVFLSLSQDKIEDSLCTIFKLPSSVIDGLDDSDNKYVGLENLKSTYDNFISESNFITGQNDNLNGIVTSNVNTKTNEVQNLVNIFVNNYKQQKIDDANGLSSIPNSVIALEDGINPQIGSEIQELDNVGQKLVKSAQVGFNYSSPGYTQSIQSVLNIVNQKLQLVIDSLEKLTDPGSENIDDGMKYAQYGYWFLFVFGILILVVAGFALIILCCMCSKNKCWDWMLCGKVLLVILGLFVLIFAILCFIIMVGSATLSGFCGFVGKLNTDQVDVLYKFDELDVNVRNMVELCLFTNSTGHIDSLIANAQTPGEVQIQQQRMRQIDTLLDGFSNYRKWKNSTNAATKSSHIQKQNDDWDQNELGFKYDFKNVEVILEEFNDLVDCADTKYRLTQAACTGVDNCVSINDATSFAPPSCSSDQNKAVLHFNNLKKYINHEIGLINNMQKDLADEANPTSIQTKYIQAQTALLNLDSKSLAVENVLSQSLKATRNFNSNWYSLQDCRALRKIVVQFEKETCFQFNYYLYIVLVVSCVCGVLLFIMSWMICCALRSTDEAVIEEKPLAPTPEPIDDDFEDKERMPFY